LRATCLRPDDQAFGPKGPPTRVSGGYIGDFGMLKWQLNH